jgi:hypothetical protein
MVDTPSGEQHDEWVWQSAKYMFSSSDDDILCPFDPRTTDGVFPFG